MTQRSASGWYLEVDDTGGYTHTATPLTGEVEPSRNPKANARPEITIPVPKNDKWDAILGDGSNDIDLRLWKDGVRQPIDTLEDVTQQPGYTQLEASGGIELRTRVETAFDQKAVHLAAEDLIDTETATPYTSNVDTPSTSTETNTQIDSWTSAAEFRNRLEPVPLDTDPVEVTDPGGIALQQTCFTTEGEDRDRDSGTVNAALDSNIDGEASNNQVLQLNAPGDTAEWDFTPSYRIPGDRFEVRVRDADDPNDGAPAFTWYLVTPGGTEHQIDTLTSTGTDLATSWSLLGGGSGYDGDGYDGPDLQAGETYSLKIEIDAEGNSNEFYGVDVVAPNDNGGSRFSPNYNFDNTVDTTDDTLDGPELFPETFRATFRQIPAPQAVTGAKAELTVNEGSDLSGAWAIRLSNDQGENFTDNASATTGNDTFETDSLGTDWGPSVLLEVDLSRFGSQSSTPAEGISGHEVTAVTLSADLETMPIVVNRAFDGHLDAVLKELADIGDFLWGLSWDGDNDRIAVEWTKPGQRTTDNDPTPADYTATKSTANVYQKAAVYGQSDVQVQGERFESDHGNAVPLANDRIQESGVLVRDPDTSQRFREGADYTLDRQAGEITTLSGGSMSNTSIFEIDYFYQAFGEFTKSGVGSPAEAPPAELPGLPSDFLCRQAARLIIDEVEHPLHTAEVVLPNDETGWSVVESFDPDIVPTGGNALHVKDVQNTPEGTVLTLGSRRSFGEVVDDIRAQVSAVSRKA